MIAVTPRDPTAFLVAATVPRCDPRGSLPDYRRNAARLDPSTVLRDG